MVGWHLCRFLTQNGVQTVATFNQNRLSIDGLEAIQLDLSDVAAVARMAAMRPWRAVVHLAAMTRPDDCEGAPDACRRVNIDATRMLAETLPSSTVMIFLSTDLVFDGRAGGYSELSETSPVNEYGRSKVEAERLVLRRPWSVVARTAKVYGSGSPFHPCFIDWMRKRFESGSQVPLFYDEFRSHIYIGDVVRALCALMERSPQWNLYHLGGPERMSRYEFGRLYADGFGFDRSAIERVSAGSAGRASRGADCSLDSTRFLREFGIRFRTAAAGIQALKEQAY